jgi:hypothetical protein
MPGHAVWLQRDPSLLEVLVWVGYLVTSLTFFFRPLVGRPEPSGSPATASLTSTSIAEETRESPLIPNWRTTATGIVGHRRHERTGAGLEPWGDAKLDRHTRFRLLANALANRRKTPCKSPLS